jgi:hypothetical protein
MGACRSTGAAESVALLRCSWIALQDAYSTPTVSEKGTAIKRREKLQRRGDLGQMTTSAEAHAIMISLPSLPVSGRLIREQKMNL